jgi:hypothetical protein
MSEQIQKAFDEWICGDDYTAEELSFREANHDYANRAPAFHGGYTACQARIREKIAECEKSLELYDECTIGHRATTEAINALREVLGEI